MQKVSQTHIFIFTTFSLRVIYSQSTDCIRRALSIAGATNAISVCNLLIMRRFCEGHLIELVAVRNAWFVSILD